MATKVIMPQMGESVVEGTVSRWLIEEGAAVNEYDPIVEVETDKVTSEIPAPAGGVLLKIYVAEGTTVNAGVMLAVIGQAGEAIPEGDAPAAPPAQSEPEPAPAVAAGHDNGAPSGELTAGAMPHVTPVVARIAAEHNVDVRRVTGTGRGGRVTKQDILAYLDAQQAATPPAVPAPAVDLPPWEQPGSGDLFKPTDDLYKKPAAPAIPVQQPAPARAQPAPASGPGDQLLPLSTMRRRIAEHMVLSQLHTAPHVSTVFEVDMSAVTAHRAAHKAQFERQGVRLTFTAYFVAATAAALRAHPLVNSQWTDDGVLLKGEVNIGMATALDDGLIVPVLRRADELALPGIARQVNDLAERARRNALMPDEVTGGTFTITNHGVSGSLFATPIINQPQVGILGVGAIQKRVVVLENDAIAVRPMVYLSFTFDHRVLDGATADTFVAEIKHLLEGWS
ncbi:MAG: 2-oxo acid dehydrogenase subunit E2 [Anaerolineae bacterium]|nr:2-oxo acid dehydrogenase subunit E2 [Anaerolineae bacterium]